MSQYSTPLTARQKEWYAVTDFVDLFQRGGIPARPGDVALAPVPRREYTAQATYTTPTPAGTYTIIMVVYAESAAAACGLLESHINTWAGRALGVTPEITRIGAALLGRPE